MQTRKDGLFPGSFFHALGSYILANGYFGSQTLAFVTQSILTLS